jgi:hypothetical protein
VVANINARFFNGRPSNDLGEAGVLIHMDDGQTEHGQPWVKAPGHQPEPWKVCHLGWCKGADHISCSLINAHTPATYGAGMGMLLSPRATKIACSYASDGGTQGVRQGSVGGCRDRKPCTSQVYWGCQFDDLELMMKVQRRLKLDTYNEVIVAKGAWDSAVPELIEAVGWFGASGEKAAKDMRRRFLEHFGLTRKQVPLVHYRGRTKGFVEIHEHEHGHEPWHEHQS